MAGQDKPRLISTRLRAEAERPSENPVRVKALLLEAAEALERHLLNRLEDELASSSLALTENDEPLRELCFDYRNAATAHAENYFQRIVRWVKQQEVRSSFAPAATTMPDSEADTEQEQRWPNAVTPAAFRCDGVNGRCQEQCGLCAAKYTSSAIAPKDSAFRCYDSERWPGTGRCPQQCGSCATRYTPPTSACTDLNIPVVGATSDTPRTDAVIAAADACPETRVVFLIHQLANLAKDLERKLDKALSDPRSNVGMCQRDARECREMELERDDLKRELSALKAPIADDIVEGLRVVTQRRGCKIQQGDVLAVERAINALTRSATAITENDARYQWLRVRGCAIDGTEHQREGLVRRCINLDEEIDSLRAVDIRQQGDSHG